MEIIAISISIVGLLTMVFGDITHGLLLMILAELLQIPKTK